MSDADRRSPARRAASGGPAGAGPHASPSYLDRARDGAGSAITYSLGLLLILFAWLFLGALLSAALAMVLAPDVALQDTGSVPGARGLAIALVAFIPFLLATPLVVRWVLQRPWLTVVTAAARIDWWRVAAGAGWWALLMALGTGVDALVHRDAYRWTFDAASFWPYLLVAVLLLPLQTTAEELLFRGYLVQWMSLATRRILVLAVADGLLFAVPHLANPEAAGAQWYAWLVWFLYGASWTWASVRDGSVELAVGAHLSNNLMGTVVVGYSAGVLPVASLWTTSLLDLPLTIAITAVAAVAFPLLTRRRGGAGSR